MTRICVVVEGQTEESFIKEVLAPAFWPLGKILVARILGVPGHKGGRPNYARLKRDVLILLKQESDAYCSTMIDFYALGAGFPGMPLASDLAVAKRASLTEGAIFHDICAAVPEHRPDIRFIPYIQLHEFEALLFSDPGRFASALGQSRLAQAFQQIRDAFATPEDIDDGPETAPSKRVLAAYRPYRKVLDGLLSARNVGLDAMKRECPHFREWCDRLSQLPPL